MARVTIENCLKNISNRFELVIVAAKRSHQLNSGTHSSLLDIGKDKSAIIALREIEENLIDASILTSVDNYDNYSSKTSITEVEAELNQIKLDDKDDELSEIKV